MSEGRLQRYEKWVLAAALFVSLQLGRYVDNTHGAGGEVASFLVIATPLGVGLLVQQWLGRRARAHVPPGDWRVLRWLNAALRLRDGWWRSPVQIGRAWLISGLAIGGVAFAAYREVGTSMFVGIIYPGIVLAASVWHFRHPPENGSQPLPG